VNTTEIIDTYCLAWSDPDPVRRARHLNAVWSETAAYTDPGVHLVGAEALLDHVAGIMERRPGARVLRTGAIAAHHDVAMFRWAAIGPEGQLFRSGVDFATLNQEGDRLDRVIGFFDPA
tara:strand:- start:66940 stop:67296 length:357 start_codon:yes stop_codon:yes gene_type:complete